jgi:hypothetical protein
MKSSEIKNAVVELSIRFEARYGFRWVASNDIDDRENLREKLLQWTQELEREAVSQELILKVVEVILDKAEFSDYPPTLNRFIYICKEMKKMFSEGTRGKMYLAMKRLDERFSFTYGRLWSEQDKDKSKRRLEYWKQEIEEEGLTDKLIISTLKKVRNKVAYIQYPPTLNQFIMECQFEKVNDNFVDTDIAFIKASNKEEDIHITIKMARQKIGSHTLKVGREKHIKTLFEKIYLEECYKYVSDKEGYLKKDTSSSKDKDTETPKEETPAPDNAEFFKNLAKKSS